MTREKALAEAQGVRLWLRLVLKLGLMLKLRPRLGERLWPVVKVKRMLANGSGEGPG